MSKSLTSAPDLFDLIERFLERGGAGVAAGAKGEVGSAVYARAA